MNFLSLMTYLVLFAFIAALLIIKFVKNVDEYLSDDNEDEIPQMSKEVLYDIHNVDYNRPVDLVSISKDTKNNLYYKKVKNIKEINEEVKKDTKEETKEKNVISDKNSVKAKAPIKRVDPNPKIITEMWIDENIKQVNKVLYSLLDSSFILIQANALPEWKSSWSNIAQEITQIYNKECEDVNLSYEIIDQGILLKKI